MSDLDNAAQPAAPSEPVAPPSAGGDSQASTPASEITSAPDPAKPPGEEPDKQSRREARAYANLRRENRELYRRLGGLEARLENVQQPPPADGDQPPQQRQRTAPSPRDVAQAELNRSTLERIEDAGEEYEAAAETITADGFPMTQAMRDFLVVSEKAPQLAKHLADNPKDALRISLLGERAADRALEQLEQRISAAPAAPKTTKAPPPVPTVGGRSTPNFDPDKASMEDYATYWHQREAARKR